MIVNRSFQIVSVRDLFKVDRLTSRRNATLFMVGVHHVETRSTVMLKNTRVSQICYTLQLHELSWINENEKCWFNVLDDIKNDIDMGRVESVCRLGCRVVYETGLCIWKCLCATAKRVNRWSSYVETL